MAFAAESPGWVQGKVALVTPDNCHCLKDTTGLGLGAGSWQNQRWGWELDVLRNTLQSHAGGIRAQELEFQGAALFAPFDLGPFWKPYLRAGGGVASVQTPFSLGPGTTLRPALHGGVGIQGWWSRHGMASLELRSTSIFTATSRRETQLLLGVGLRWGKDAAQADHPAQESPTAPGPAPQPLPTAAAPALPPAPPLAPVLPPAPVPGTGPAPSPAPAPSMDGLEDAVVHFANDRADITAQDRATILRVAGALAGFKGAFTLVVTGHTSSDGRLAHNQALSLRRAKAVAAVLASAGVPAARVTVLGVGPLQPVADNATLEGKAMNRRAVIQVQVQNRVWRSAL
jgi:outer membrane protein OmpA-like peptidoglycan-associated protein